MQIKLIYMSDGLFVYKTEDGYSVLNHQGYILKSAKTIQTCDRFVQKELESRRAAEKKNNVTPTQCFYFVETGNYE